MEFISLHKGTGRIASMSDGLIKIGLGPEREARENGKGKGKGKGNGNGNGKEAMHPATNTASPPRLHGRMRRRPSMVLYIPMPNDEKIQRVLEVPFSDLDIGIKDTRELRLNPDQPQLDWHTQAVDAVDRAIEYYRLDEDQQRELFHYLQWQFECIDCHAVKYAEAFGTRGFILWGDTHPPQRALRCGPCIDCTERAAKQANGPAIVPYKVVQP